MDGLLAEDREQGAERRELLAERRATSELLRQLSQASAHGALGLLPNYSLTDTTTSLEATLYWKESAGGDDAEGGEDEHREQVYRSETRDYERSRKLALTELAPGNSFYVNGYRHVVRALDIGTPERRAWAVWRLYPACGYARTHGDPKNDTSPCPRCGSREIADAGWCTTCWSRGACCPATSGTTPGCATTATHGTAGGTRCSPPSTSTRRTWRPAHDGTTPRCSAPTSRAGPSCAR